MNNNMNTADVMDLQKDDGFSGFLRVLKSDELKDKNGKTYFNLTLSDKTGAINAKVWDAGLLELPPQGSILKIASSNVTEFKGNLQLRVTSFRVADENDGFDLSQLVATSPESSEKMFEYLDEMIASIKNETLNKIVSLVVDSVREKLYYYPAAQMMHHVTHGGLLHHITSMLKVADSLAACYPHINRDLLLSGVIVHDLGKTIELASDTTGAPLGYTKDGLLFGHLLRGFSMLGKAAEKAGIPEDDEMFMLLQHMMVSHHGLLEHGSLRMPMFAEAEMLYFIDNLDARMNEFETITNQLTPGSFSERKAFLGNRSLYRPVFEEDET
jgi:3'-5' exoribonuclease